MRPYFKIKAKIILCMEVGGRRYGQPKTAAMAIARAIADNLERRVRRYDNYGRWIGEESAAGYRRRITRKAYRRIKARVEKAFNDYVIA
jgi:hypothetical protein